MGKRSLLLFHLMMPVLISSLGHTSYAQDLPPDANSTRHLLESANNTDQNPVNDTNNASDSSHKLSVISSIFPINEFVKKVGGNMITSTLIIPAGIEPHDFEPTISQIQTISSADVLIYNGLGIENWLTKIESTQKIDTSNELNASYSDKRNMTLDPHVWLDPLLAKKQVENIRDGLITIDPKNKDYYNSNAKSFLAELDELDKTIRIQLESCNKNDFISFHNSFTYFANRYGLTQHSISESGPDAEVTPARLAEIINVAKTLDLDVIYSEELMDSRYAQVIAQEIPNGKVLVLSPIEGLTKNDQDEGIGYIDKMHENIRNLSLGLECSQ
ncbi:MAG TPA: zinc ABC transporter substrate-binding protein [Nitrososphaeraceae archaeon]|nr:zinc ABC transporter substrate-binding protein [Nitrososphaeraceae archaeon]